MDHATAKQLAEQHCAEPNFMRIKIRYDLEIILPYQDGLACIASLAKAEELRTGYREASYLGGISNTGYLTFTPMSATEYRRHKMSGLMGIPYETLEEMDKTVVPDSPETIT